MAVRSKIIASYRSSSDPASKEPTRQMACVTGRNTTRQAHVEEPESYIGIDFGTTITTVARYKRGTPMTEAFTSDNFTGEKQLHKTNRQSST